MAEPLKRTFHGCLTCRKRKVRCQGGNPCPNCSRMNINCHSSFDTNLRIRVSTPTGQKVVSSKQPQPKRVREQAPAAQSQHAAAPSSLMTAFDSHSESFNVNFQQQQQYPAFSMAAQAPAFTSEAPNLEQLSPATCGPGIQDLDALQFNVMWGGFDFPLDANMAGHDFNGRMDMTAALVHIHPTSFDSLAPGTPISQQSNPISDSEGSVSSKSQNRDGTKEWVPRRRKRAKKTAPADEASRGSAAQKILRATELFSPASHMLEDFTTEHDSKWSFARFVLDYGQKHPCVCPMRIAALAWAARATLPEGSPIDPSVLTCYSQSSEQFEKLQAIPNPTLVLNNLPPVMNAAEIIICTALFLNRYDIADQNLEAVDNRLQRLTRWLASHPGNLKLSAFASKLLLWSCYLQIRISMFNPISPRFATLLNVVSDRTDYHFILEKSHSFRMDMFGRDYPKELLAEDAQMIPATLRLHETFCLLSDMVRFRSFQRSGATAQDLARWSELAASEHSAIDNGIQRAEAEFELAAAMNPTANILRQVPIPRLYVSDQSTEQDNRSPSNSGDNGNMTASQSGGKLSRVSLHWLMVYGVLLTAKIVWSRTFRSEVRTDDASTEAVESILQIGLLLRKAHGHQRNGYRELATTLWPLPLFVAGIETADDVRADWLRIFMSHVINGENEAERERNTKSGSRQRRARNGGKVLELMEHIRKMQDAVGKRVSVPLVTAENAVPQAIFEFLC
ncbi:hypothetical protein B0T26DRAFT_153587 [Lasiosphaeria miniovina]|uniref:Zn(2)-C6 fungal-type domain-containing protein n=1 Tax=Lasiosphaeria miniovina TaxID=1954250 RepID=A0AA40E7K4_9PEZI|nr:uncharacterized protein B0T26DRAFT_153587 [Lasiosphaeria miniovina]KAK0728002.1 hypothetical protein B0T26DRAFT_153587 [Lasiosphaeria miniovina]